VKNKISFTEKEIKKNKERLNSMAERAKERVAFLKKHWTELNTEKCYIRINSSGYRAVSLDNRCPLCGFRKHPTRKIEEMLEHCAKPSIEYKERLERRIQSHLIKYALAHNLDLKPALGLNDTVYDELLFALDEVPLVNINNKAAIRCDILAVGVQGKNAFPVLIELKFDRQKTELGRQLKDFCALMNHKFPKEFANLLGNCVNKEVKMSKIGKMIIWPAPADETAKETMPYFEKEGIDVIEYKVNPEKDVDNRVFEPILEPRLLKGPRDIKCNESS
jgi:ferredoxin-thioredoxin reductase catalytic subunit